MSTADECVNEVLEIHIQIILVEHSPAATRTKIRELAIPTHFRIIFVGVVAGAAVLIRIIIRVILVEVVAMVAGKIGLLMHICQYFGA